MYKEFPVLISKYTIQDFEGLAYIDSSRAISM